MQPPFYLLLRWMNQVAVAYTTHSIYKEGISRCDIICYYVFFPMKNYDQVGIDIELQPQPQLLSGSDRPIYEFKQISPVKIISSSNKGNIGPLLSAEQMWSGISLDKWTFSQRQRWPKYTQGFDEKWYY